MCVVIGIIYFIIFIWLYCEKITIYTKGENKQKTKQMMLASPSGGSSALSIDAATAVPSLGGIMIENKRKQNKKEHKWSYNKHSTLHKATL